MRTLVGLYLTSKSNESSHERLTIYNIYKQNNEQGRNAHMIWYLVLDISVLYMKIHMKITWKFTNIVFGAKFFLSFWCCTSVGVKCYRPCFNLVLIQHVLFRSWFIYTLLRAMLAIYKQFISLISSVHLNFVNTNQKSRSESGEFIIYVLWTKYPKIIFWIYDFDGDKVLYLPQIAQIIWNVHWNLLVPCQWGIYTTGMKRRFCFILSEQYFLGRLVRWWKKYCDRKFCEYPPGFESLETIVYEWIVIRKLFNFRITSF